MSDPNDTATLVLSGQILLPDFARAIDGFGRLVSALDKEFGKGIPIDWAMDNLETAAAERISGRALASTRGLWETPQALEAVEAVVEGYEAVGAVLRDHAPLANLPQSLHRPAHDLNGLINGHIKSIRFETVRKDADVYAADVQERLDTAAPSRPLRVERFGAIRGRVESMSRRGGLRFTLYDSNDDMPVSCYLEKSRESLMQAIWGRIAVVEGLVRRDPITGRATTIRQVTEIRLLSEGDSWNFERARGASGWKPGDPPAEKTIRLVRDG